MKPVPTGDFLQARDENCMKEKDASNISLQVDLFVCLCMKSWPIKDPEVMIRTFSPPTGI
jgi:hypothetical protein